MTKLQLSERESRQLEQYLRETTAIGQAQRLEGLVSLLNKLREPVPLGTVRVSPEGYVAVKHGLGANDQWWVYRFGTGRNNSPESDDHVADWTNVYKPGDLV